MVRDRGGARAHGHTAARAAWAAIVALIIAWAQGCGARSELFGAQPLDAPPSGAFCARATLPSGFDDVSIYLLLDKSDSMNLDDKWLSATAALSALVADPDLTGVRIALQFYPLDRSCDVEPYATPAVPMLPLPQGATQVVDAMAAQEPEGATPLIPALRGSIEHARGLLFAEPRQAVVIAVVTDGSARVCGSNDEELAALAREAAEGTPAVPIYVIGLRTAGLPQLNLLAQSGGTGAPILVDDAMLAQGLVDAIVELRSALQACRFNLPVVDGAVIRPSDVTVSIRLDDDDDPSLLPRVDTCSGEGFLVGLDGAPTVELCPASCNAVRAVPTSKVDVSVGCGQSSGSGIEPPSKPCNASSPFRCVDTCDAPDSTVPECVGGLWTCPEGTRSTSDCEVCPPVPHGCCGPDAALANASCVDGDWICPAGFSLFGTPGCLPPDACAANLPCPSDAYCDVPDDSCGVASTLGQCVPRPQACDDAGPQACTCGGSVASSPCAAAQSGFDVSRSGCGTLPNTQRCGPLFCPDGTSECRRISTVTDLEPDRYECAPPVPCNDPCDASCSVADACGPCPAGVNCSKSCIDEGDGPILLCLRT